MNSIIILLYRIRLLPLFGIGKRILILKTIGRRTGKIRRRPVLHKKMYTNKITLYSARGKKSDWLKNILSSDNNIVEIIKGFRKFKAKATLIESEEEKANHLIYWCRNFKDAKTLFGYNLKEHGDIFNTEEFTKLVKMLEFIQLEIL